ncbi:Mechanosensory protein 2 [Fasciola gigantica]|uniref:Mechanosensory protein 2 n=1 Tax=Fasciola gigantica TaxID=46835 RepID=A0A504Z397_FASGI|nr:Mechanosensory protein 2 [Fasciola gigantica]
MGNTGPRIPSWCCAVKLHGGYRLNQAMNINQTKFSVLTKDSVTVAVDAVVYYRIYNPVVAITNVEDADRSTRLLAATTLRNVLGTRNLAEILSERESISTSMQVGCLLSLFRSLPLVLSSLRVDLGRFFGQLHYSSRI